MKEQLLKLLQLVIICATVIFLFILYQSVNKNIDSDNLNLEKQKFEYQKQIFQYLNKVDSLESHINSLQDTKKENLVAAKNKKRVFRELTPTEQVITFNNLFHSLTKDEPK